jgi:hypothetical protein
MDLQNQAEEVAQLERQILSDYMTFARASGALEVSLTLLFKPSC